MSGRMAGLAPQCSLSHGGEADGARRIESEPDFQRVVSLAALAALPKNPFAADAAHPMVVELFESQGCSDCPPAVADVVAISDRADILALVFAVDYWDRLGWKDTFSARSRLKARRPWPSPLCNAGDACIAASRTGFPLAISAPRRRPRKHSQVDARMRA
jgi:hypothetical protein